MEDDTADSAAEDPRGTDPQQKARRMSDIVKMVVSLSLVTWKVVPRITQNPLRIWTTSLTT
eukprot:4810868-Heterocapsa_arctica.AAC.1